MNRSPASRRVYRLGLLAAILALCLLALAAQRMWLSPEAREARLSRMNTQAMEAGAGRSRDPLLHYHLARRRLEAGDIAGGIEALETVLRLDPGFSRARATLGTALLATDQDQEALLHLRQVVEDDPSDVNGYLGLALLYGRHESWHLQEKAAATATEVDPNHVDAWILRGQAAERRRDPGEAARCYERAAVLAPRQARAHALAAHGSFLLGQLDRAEQHAVTATQVEPKNPAGFAALGEVLLRRGRSRSEEAVSAFEKAIALGESGGSAYQGLGEAFQLQRRYLDAEQQFRLALRADRSRNEARYGLARVLRAQGRTDEAAAVEREYREWQRLAQQQTILNDRVSANPENEKHWFALAQLYVRQGLWPQARRTVLSGLRRAPTDPLGRKLLAEVDRNAR